ncbi:MAG: hypothetical protein H5T61_01115 [Thermoflexales bacterium]|nr:hypothetical protein [Thermoflexales bacterium]
MHGPLPSVVRQAWGENIADAFTIWLEDWGERLVREKAVPRDEYREVLSRLDVLDREVALLREEQTLLRSELRQEIHNLRQEMLNLHQATQERLDREFGQIQERLDREFGQIQERLDREFGQIQERMDRESGQIQERLDRMYQQMVVQTRWLIGALLGFGTIITVLLAIAQFTP